MKRPSQIVGNIGLYYVCFKLSELGWNVMPTSRNARGIDVICFSMDGTRMLTIQVKSLSKRNPVPLGEGLDKIMGNFWVIVNSLDTGKPLTYILLPHEVRAMAHRDKKEGRCCMNTLWGWGGLARTSPDAVLPVAPAAGGGPLNGRLAGSYRPNIP